MNAILLQFIQLFGGEKMKSWKTTVAGFVAAFAILFGQANNYLDADAATVVSYEQVMLALGMLGIGWFAKDKNTTGVQ